MDPLRPVREAEVARFDVEADVAIVGLGCAGACAAIEAREAGATVVVLERASGGGGTSAQSGGLIYLGGGTPVQKACGYDDSADAMYAFLMEACGPNADAIKMRAYCDGSVEHFHWLEAHGVPFKRSSYLKEPSMEAPTDDCLVFSGGEDTWPFDEITPAVPRGHKPRFEDAAGGFLMRCLIAAVEKSGARIECDVLARALVVDEQGGVVGVLATRGGERVAVRAKRGVVLAAGGFILDDAMLDAHAPVLKKCSWRLSAGGDDGSGIKMGQGVGAAVARMSAGECAIPLTPPRPLVRGVMVNRFGQRFINEDTYYGRVGQEALFRQGGLFYWIHDEATYQVNRVRMQVEFAGETFEELEREIGLPEGSLVATMELYNRHARAGRDPVFGKRAPFLVPIEKPPFGAIRVATDNSTYATFTLGGLQTDVGGAVLSHGGEPIPGLYAAGRTTAGLAAEGYASGISLGDGTFFGRAAGRSAARRAGAVG